MLSPFQRSKLKALCKSKPLWVIGILFVLLSAFELLKSIDISGFGSDETISKSVERDPNGGTIKTVTTTTPQPAKTFWDLLSVIGVPVAVVYVGALLQAQQQRQSDITLREEALKEYIDAIADLLIEKNLIAIANKVKAEELAQAQQETKEGSLNEQSQKATEAEIQPLEALQIDANPRTTTTSPSTHIVSEEQKELLKAAGDVIQARTSSLLRRLGNDLERKAAAIKFLADSEVIEKVGLQLKGVNLSGINLSWANLRNIDLEGTNLSDANFEGAILDNATFFDVDLTGAVLRNTNFTTARLYKTSFIATIVADADFNGADLWDSAFNQARFWNTKFTDACLNGTTFTNVKLNNSDFANTDLDQAIFDKCDLTSVENLTEEQIRKAYLREAKLPEEYSTLSNHGSSLIDDPDDLKSLR